MAMLSIEEEKLLDEFFKDEKLFIRVEGTDDDAFFNEKYFFDDFKEAKEITSKPGIYTYTVVIDEDDTAWLIDGWHFVNRVGYYFTTKKIDIPEEGLRYW